RDRPTSAALADCMNPRRETVNDCCPSSPGRTGAPTLDRRACSGPWVMAPCRGETGREQANSWHQQNEGRQARKLEARIHDARQSQIPTRRTMERKRDKDKFAVPPV